MATVGCGIGRGKGASCPSEAETVLGKQSSPSEVDLNPRLGLEKHICFSALNSHEKDKPLKFYIWKVLTGPEKKRSRQSRSDCRVRENQPTNTVQQLRTSESHNCTRLAHLVALNSTLYLIGGLGDFSRNLLYVDASAEERERIWRKGPSLLHGRVLAESVVLDGKIYVFGGISKFSPGPWAEVFDPCLGQWKALPTPPQPSWPSWLPVCGLSVATLDGPPKRILVSSNYNCKRLLFSYDVVKEDWEEFVDDENVPSSFICSVGVGNTLYCFRAGDCHLYAYDFSTKMWFSGLLSGPGLKAMLHSGIGDYVLLHLAGEYFCLFWTGGISYSLTLDKAVFYCTVFHVAKVVGSHQHKNGMRRLKISLLSCQSQQFDDNFKKMDALLL